MNEDDTALVTATGEPLLITSVARAHLQAHPGVWSVLGEAVTRLTLPEVDRLSAFEVDLQRPLQLNTLLPAPTIDLDTSAMFAVRVNRAHPSRVTDETPTLWDSTIVLWVKPRDQSSAVELATAFIGKLAPLEPWAPQLAAQPDFQIALDFWCRHALVYDSQVMQPIVTTTWRQILRQAQSPFVDH